MALELAEITAELEGNAELLTGVTSHILETEKGKEILTNRADVLYQERIGDEVSSIHSRYDEDAFSIIGEKPGQLEDGTKQKTYDFIKSKMEELKGLREQKDSLSKDAAVAKLNAEIADLKKNGPGAHWEQTFNTEKQKWTAREQELSQRAEAAENRVTDYIKRVDMETGLRGLTFNEDVPEEARKALINSIMAKMNQHSKVEGDNVLYLDEQGAVINNSEYKPKDAKAILEEALSSILVTENNEGGGGAPPTVAGSIETVSVEGKDVKRLKLNEQAFTTKTEFIKVMEKALLDEGVSRGSADWKALEAEAYNRYNVSKLPR